MSPLQRGHLRRPTQPLSARKPGNQPPRAALSARTRSSHLRQPAQAHDFTRGRMLRRSLLSQEFSCQPLRKILLLLLLGSQLLLLTASHDILAPTQETVTTVPKTQLGGDSSKEEASEDEALEDKASEEEASNKDDMEAALEMDNPPVGNIYLSEDAPTNPFADEGDSSNNDILGEFNDPYHKMLVESAIDYSFDDRLDYFLRGGPITMKIRAAVETCVLGEAGKSVSEEENVSKVPVLQDLLAKKYGEIMSSLNPRLFETAELREDMCTKRLGGRPGKTNKDTTFGVKKMWESWLKMKTEMKKIFTRLPANYHKMKSGTQLYDVYDNLIRDHWREAFVSLTLLSVPCQSQLIPSFFLFFLFIF
jgi:hypothetical protein